MKRRIIVIILVLMVLVFSFGFIQIHNYRILKTIYEVGEKNIPENCYIVFEYGPSNVTDRIELKRIKNDFILKEYRNDKLEEIIIGIENEKPRCFVVKEEGEMEETMYESTDPFARINIMINISPFYTLDKVLNQNKFRIITEENGNYIINIDSIKNYYSKDLQIILKREHQEGDFTEIIKEYKTECFKAEDIKKEIEKLI